MAVPEINLPPYDGNNKIELSKILIGSAADFRANLNNNTQEIADAVNLNTQAFALWTKAWVENIGLIYWTGLQEEVLTSGNNQKDVRYIQDTDIPKLINSYKVSVKYGGGQTEIEFDTHYRDENGQSVSYIDDDSGIDIVINSTYVKVHEDNKDKYHRYINITNNSTATDVRLTMEIDQKASRAWKEIIEDLSEDTIEEIGRTGDQQVTRVETEGTKQIGQVNDKGQDMKRLIEQSTFTKLNAVFTGSEQERQDFESISLGGLSVYLWLDTGENS